ncbi:N-terminal phage integrase SAM-like domain-containing protein [Nocardioides sp. B-3]|uniref:N-terminal phage integrase SAM-like domain-containing protein n=1 Tax=Nocardioides sp. B-3 TaxID=2895565 RepID=UPI0021535A9A|nr:N-terminal phage integrase SAM-like domain-containing protein [Nocardioides sp. B-3]UUZ59016.1 hypothetical protein LP418_24000 [Nocardioides sp. B-3]
MDRVTVSDNLVTAETSVAKLAGLWLQYLRDEGRIERTTVNEYERVLTKVVIPELGGLRLRELTTSRLDMFPGPTANDERQSPEEGEGGDGLHAWHGRPL